MSAKKETEVVEKFLGTGRRKRATARVRIQAGTGNVVINDRNFSEYCPTETLAQATILPLITVDLKDKIDVQAKVEGGGINGQSGAIALGIARALQRMDPELRAPLKKAGLLKRDPRKKERKKAGQPGARKKFQFSKR